MPSKKSNKDEVTIDQRKADDRRNDDRRQKEVAVAEERRSDVPRRAKVARRRQIDPTTCERDYTDCEIEFMSALDAYKRSAGRMFPTCSEILEVLRDLGYARLTEEEAAARAALAAEEASGEEAEVTELTEEASV